MRAGTRSSPGAPQDSLALYKLFAWGLSESIDASLVLERARRGARRRRCGALLSRAGRESPPGAARATAAAAPWVSRGVRALRASFGLAAHGVGSSAFAVGGRQTESGYPVLVADSHFEPISPAALYLAHLRSPGVDIAGATLRRCPDLLVGPQSRSSPGRP